MSDVDSMTMSAASPGVKLVALTNQQLGRKERTMIIIGVDYHPEFQRVALVDTDQGVQRSAFAARRESDEILPWLWRG
jgi:hypothetical protein